MLKGCPMFGSRRIIALACFCGPLLNAALAQDDVKKVPPPTQLEQARPVKLLHLNHADAEAVEKGLSRIFPSDDVRIVADKRTNSVIVTAPAATQDVVTSLIAKLDVPPVGGEVRPSRGNAMETEVVSIRGANADVITKALDGLLAAKQAKGEGASVVVVRASPAARKALETVSQTQTTVQDQGQSRPLKPLLENLGFKVGATHGQNVRIKVLHLSGEEATATEKALAQALSARGAKPNVIVTSPTD
jgi:hypothetical protein